MQYRIVDGTAVMDGWLEYARFASQAENFGAAPPDKKVMVFIPASWGNKQAALKVMQAGLAGLIMPEGRYRLVAGSEADIVAAVDKTKCMLLGAPICQTQRDGNVEIKYQAVIEFSDTVTQARETWGELIASRMRAHVAQPG